MSLGLQDLDFTPPLIPHQPRHYSLPVTLPVEPEPTPGELLPLIPMLQDSGTAFPVTGFANPDVSDIR